MNETYGQWLAHQPPDVRARIAERYEGRHVRQFVVRIQRRHGLYPEVRTVVARDQMDAMMVAAKGQPSGTVIECMQEVWAD